MVVKNGYDDITYELTNGSNTRGEGTSDKTCVIGLIRKFSQRERKIYFGYEERYLMFRHLLDLKQMKKVEETSVKGGYDDQYTDESPDTRSIRERTESEECVRLKRRTTDLK